MSKEQGNKLFNGLDLKKQRSKFDMGFRNQFSANFGKMIPTMCVDVMPGDHVENNTEFFTRWLTMLAPTFNKIDLKFNQFYVHNSSLWGGWPQFMGEGDDMSSDYLLGHEARNGMKVPYLTTRQLAKFFTLNMFKPTAKDGTDANSALPLAGFALSDFMKKKYRLCFGLFLCQLSRNPMQVTSSSDTQLENETALINAVLWRKPEIMAFPFICRKNDGLVDSLIDLGYCIECTGNESSQRLAKFVKGCRSQRKCMYLPSFNLEWLSSFAKTEGEDDFGTWNFELASQDIIFPSSRHFCTLKYFTSDASTVAVEIPTTKDLYEYKLSSQSRVSVYHSGIHIDSDVANADTVYSQTTKTNARVVAFYDLIGYTLSSDEKSLAIDYSKEFSDKSDYSGYLNYYYPCGGEKVFPLSRYSAYAVRDTSKALFSGVYLAYFYLAEKILVHLLGSGTLSDYLGLNLTQSVVLNDDLIAEGVYHYVQTHQNDLRGNYGSLPWGSEGSVYSRASKSQSYGTYHEQVNTFEVAVINDEPISLLPYLAYKRCWNDLVRDPRFQIHDYYCNRYTSPFLVPLSNGSYHNGECFRVSDEGRLLVDAPNFFDDGYTPTIFNIWHKDSFFEFFEMRDRRISHDCFTLITPNNQWGDEVVAEGTAGGSDISLVHADGTPMSGGNYAIKTGTSTYSGTDRMVEYIDSTTRNQLGVKGLVSSISVNALRLAGAIQKFMERNNIVGSDFVKQQIAHFGVSPEHRNEVAHYLGGDKFNMNVSPIDMLGGNTDSQTTGQQTAQATCSGKACKFRYDVKEHGYLLQWVTIQNNFTYTTQLKKQFIDKYDYPFVEYANLAPEEVPLKMLVNCDGSVYGADDYSPLRRYGFAPRYWWAKFCHDEIHGDFKKSLSYWVSTRKISSGLFGGLFGWKKRPIIGADMQYENPDYKCFTYSGEDYGHCLFDMKHHLYISRNLPILPNPQID